MNPNSNGSFVSRLQPPSAKIPDPTQLQELSASTQNARPNSMAPPPNPSNGTKRKALAEQAGEFNRPAPAPPGSRAPHGIVKAGSLSSLGRHKSLASTTSSRPLSSASSTSNVSSSSQFSQSVGSGRSVYSQSSRPHTSSSNYSNGARSGFGGHRSASSLDHQGRGMRTASTEGSQSNSRRDFSSSSSKSSGGRKNPQTPKQSNDSLVLSSGMRVTELGMEAKSLREFSLSTKMSNLSLSDSSFWCDEAQEERPKIDRICNVPQTPSQLPTIKKKKRASMIPLSSPTKSPSKKTPKPPTGGFLNRSTNIRAADWDVSNRVDRVETLYAELKGQLELAAGERDSVKDTLSLLKTKNTELEGDNMHLKRINSDLQREVDEIKAAKSSAILALEEYTRKQTLEMTSLTQELEHQRRAQNIELEDLMRQKRRDLDDARREAEDETRSRERVHREEVADLKKKLQDALDEEREARRKEMNALSSEGQMAQQRAEVQLMVKDKEVQTLRDELELTKAHANRGEDLSRDLRAKISEASTNINALESSLRSSKARVEFLESDSKSQSQAFADLEQKTQDAVRESQEAKAKLRAEETLRRKLHNQVQELKGNIRVFCRVRPNLPSDATDKASVEFPDSQEDCKEVDIVGPEEKSSLGTITTKKNAFSFDRVFVPSSQNSEVFDEISQLVQSALDGYNVCIFCYGQTGSGKTFTMSSNDGMIPRAVHQIYETAQSLEEKGWTYSMEGSFVEIYNENINDLLGKAEELDKKKHEIRHDTQKLKTTITGVNTIVLDSPDEVHSVLNRAMKNRSVAATKANERSSRSHSVFILKLAGANHVTGEKSEGTLNLVDLAGSERLSHSGATGDRLKETQSINKSLSSLGDVIAALGQGKEGGHIPYRNSKLTHLLQYSLGGNSKTLMFVMISPLQAHLSETLTSLKFATKVHNTHIGTAKRQSKVRD